MSCFDVKILDPNINTIEIESCIGDQPSSIDIVTYDNTSTIEINHCIPIPSDIYASGIIDFVESVQDIIGQSGLAGGSYVNLNYNDVSGLTTISVSGLQPSGNYSNVGHSHSSSDITNFNSSVSGLLPTISGSGYVNSNFANNIYTISVSGLQPSGNYSTVGHTHTSSQITDFNTSVSGLIPPSNFTSLIGISGVFVTNSGTDYVVSLSDPTIQLVDITDLSSNARNFLLTPSSDNLSTLVTNETGSGVLVFNTSPSFSGIPTVPTAPSGTNNTQIANTSFVRTEISNLVNSAPSTLDTLNELATALGNDPNFAITITNSLANKAALSGAIFTGSVTIPSGTGNFNSLTINGINVSLSGHSHSSSDITNFNSSVSGLLPSVTGTGYATSNFANNVYTISVTGLQPSGNYSTIGHTHTSNNITDFNSSVSGLLPSVIGSGYVNSLFANNVYTISVSGLQPSGNYSVDGHSHIIADVSGLQNSLDGKQPSGVYASGIHYHISSDITDFNSSVSGLLPSVTGVGQASSTFVNNIYTVSVSGLQPSGNYANSVHTHSSSDITNFNSSVSGLLPVKNISSGSGIGISSVSGDFTVSVTGSFGLTSEEVDDRVSNLLVAGSYINLNYDDNLNSLTISSTGLQPSGNYSIVGHSHISSDITDFNSSVSGLIPVKNILGGTGISVNSVSGIYTVTSTGSGVLADQAASLVTTVFNKTGSPIPKMTAVYINGGQGDMPTVSLAIATSDMTSAGTYGVTYEAIGNMTTGKVIVFGALTGLNTDQFNPTAPMGDVNGTILYLSPSVSGALTTTKPSAPNHIVTIGTIVRTHQNDGVVEVRIQNGFELEELHNVAISGVTNGQFLQYNSASGLWLASSSGNFTNLSVNNTGVSLVGHSHTSSDITNFNTSVSGLLPTIANSGDNRILTSTGSSLGINAETNLTFDGSFLNVVGSGSFSNNVVASGFVRTGGTSNQFLKADGSVDSNSYYLNSNPSGYTTNVGTVTNVSALTIGTTGTDISSSVANGTTTPVITINVPTASASNRGVLSSSDWTTFNNKQAALTNPVTGVGTSGYLSKWIDSNSVSSGIIYDNGTSIGIGTAAPSGQLHVVGTGIFNNSIRLGSSLTAGTIVGLSATGTVPAIIFDTVGNNHGNSQVIYDFRENGTSFVSINGFGNLQANAGNIVSTATNPSADNGSFIGQGMRRRLSNAGIEFAWGESITSITEPGIDLFPIGGTHIASGILFRLSKNSTKTDVAMLVNGSGNIGIGTTTPSGQLHVIGTGIFSSGLGIGTTSPQELVHISGAIAASNGNLLRLNNGNSSNNPRIDFRIGGVGNFDDHFFISRNGTDVFGIETNNRAFFSNSIALSATRQLLSYNNVNAFIEPQQTTANNSTSNFRIGYISPASLIFLASYTERMRLTASGNLGIGTSTPSGQLHVIGTGLFSGSVGIGTNSPSSTLDVNGNVNIDGNLTFDSFTESVVSIGNSSSGVVLSLTSGTVQTCTLTNNCTFTMPSTTAGKSFKMFLNTGSGNYTPSFSGVRWAGSASPTGTILANKVDIYSFISDGSFWYGSFSQNYG